HFLHCHLCISNIHIVFTHQFSCAGKYFFIINTSLNSVARQCFKMICIKQSNVLFLHAFHNCLRQWVFRLIFCCPYELKHFLFIETFFYKNICQCRFTFCHCPCFIQHDSINRLGVFQMFSAFKQQSHLSRSS